MKNQGSPSSTRKLRKQTLELRPGRKEKGDCLDQAHALRQDGSRLSPEKKRQTVSLPTAGNPASDSFIGNLLLLQLNAKLNKFVLQ